MADLTPPDLTRCQAEKPNDESFMTIGGGPKRVRCTVKPTVIATEKMPGPDGLRGSMSLCSACAVKLEEQMPGYATVVQIERPAR